MEDIQHKISYIGGEGEYDGQRKNVQSRNISNIDWFRPKTQEDPSQEALKNYLKKINQEYNQNEQQGDKQRDDILFRKTKIICTLGKYTRNLEAICKLIKEGCQIFRINMSIQQNKDLKELIQWIRSAEKITKTKVGIMIDLQGPVIRTCEFRAINTPILLKGGQEYRILCKRKIAGDESFATVDYKDLAKKIKVNDHIIADFGSVCMRVIGFEDQHQFLVGKQLEGVDMNPAPKQARTNKMSLSFQGQKIRHPDFSKKFAPPDQSQATMLMPLASPVSQSAANIPLGGYLKQFSRSRADTIDNDSEVDQIQLDTSVKEIDLQHNSQENKNMDSKTFGTQLETVIEEDKPFQEKKKFKVRFDDVYEANHIEKSRVEKEFFENAIKNKRYGGNKQIKSQKFEDNLKLDDSPLRGGQKESNNLQSQNISNNFANYSLEQQQEFFKQPPHKSQTLISPNTSSRVGGNFPELSVIQEEKKVDSNSKINFNISSLDQDQIANAAESSKPLHQSDKSLVLFAGKQDNTSLGRTSGGLKTVGSALNIQGQQHQENDLGGLPKRGSQLSLRNRKKRIIKKDKKVIICKVEFDCEIKPHKPLYFPDFDHKNEFEMSVVTQKDVLDIYSCIKLGVDFISVSYVECKQDLLEVKELLSIKGRHIKIIAKIQNRKAIENFQEILEAADGIIIARGYLGLDLKLEDVAFVQKYLIKQCNLAGKPVILSTQIMESMVSRLRPTRAEVSDISNAVFDGVDCCLLSSETQTGPFYKEACETMSKICYEAEKHIDYEKNYIDLQKMIFDQNLTLSIGEAISNCAVKAAYEINAKLIIVFTNSGQSAITVSKYRPQCPILAVSASDKSAKQCMISKGIYTFLVGSLIGADSLLDKVKKEASKRGLIKVGDYIVVTTGINEGLEGSTNLLKVLQV